MRARTKDYGRPDRTRCIVEKPEESESALGGRTTAWVECGVVWAAFVTRGLNERPVGEERAWGQPKLVETAQAICRLHPEVRRGRRLRTADGDWTVVVVEADRPAPGRSIVHLRRG